LDSPGFEELQCPKVIGAFAISKRDIPFEIMDYLENRAEEPHGVVFHNLGTNSC